MIKKIWLCLLLTTSITAASPTLVVFDLDDAYIASTRVELKVIQKFEGHALAVVDKDVIESLKKLIDDVRVVDEVYLAGSYWLEHRPWRLKDFAQDIPDVIFQTEHFRLFKAPPAEVEILRQKGLFITAVGDISLPLKPHIKQPATAQPSPGTVTDLDSLVELVLIDSLESYIQRLQDFQTRYTCTDSNQAASQWLENKFYDFGYDQVEIQSFNAPSCTSVNIICTKPGTVYLDEYIIIGGHYDSINNYEDPEIFAPGADDNGTGTALTLELARILAEFPLRKTVRFICFGAEEQGLYGSYYYAFNAYNNGDDIALMMNNDMVGYLGDDYLDFIIYSNEEATIYGDLIGSMAQMYTPLIPVRYYNVYGNSDHYPFHQFGYPVTDVREADFSPYYHSSYDLLENLDLDYFSYVTIANLGALYTVSLIPGPVQGLTALNSGDGTSILLIWDILPDPELAYYNVYVGAQIPEMELHLSTTTNQALIDSLSEGQPYYIGVTAVTIDGYEGLMDDIVEAVPLAVPHKPDTLLVSPLFGAIQIAWSPTRDLDFDHYNLYRREQSQPDYALYTQLESDTFFVDNDVNSGVKYFYCVSVMDTTGLESDLSNEDYSFPVTFDMGILLVDETHDGNGSQGYPNDAQQDSFYQIISANYIAEFYDYNQENGIRLNDIGPYSTLAWFDEDVLNQHLCANQEMLAGYLDLGGNLLYVGWRAFNPFGDYPITFEDTDVPYQYFGISGVNAIDTVDFIGALDAGQWPDVIPDSFRVLPIWHGALRSVEVIEPVDEDEVIYRYSSLSGDTLVDDKPCGLVHQGGNYNVVYLTFPLYHAGEGTASQVFQQAMELFGEQSVFIEEWTDLPVQEKISLGQNFPNPFNSATNISYRINQACQVNLSVYNILGQKLLVLYDGFQQPGQYSVSFSSEGLPSGVYFYRLSDGKSSFTRRMIILH